MRWALVMALTGAVSGWAQDDAEEHAKQKLAAFKDQVKHAKNSDDVEVALKALGEFKHPRCLSELLTWLKQAKDSTKLAAVKEIAKYREDKKAAQAVADALQSLNSNPKTDKDIIVAFFEAFGKIGYRAEVERIHGYLSNRSIIISRAAIEACAEIRSYRSFTPLLNLLRQLEAIQDPNRAQQLPNGAPGVPKLPGGNYVTRNDLEWEMYQRKQQLTPVVLSALKAVAGESRGKSGEWEAWWNKNGAALKKSEEEQEKK